MRKRLNKSCLTNTCNRCWRCPTISESQLAGSFRMQISWIMPHVEQDSPLRTLRPHGQFLKLAALFIFNVVFRIAHPGFHHRPSPSNVVLIYSVSRARGKVYTAHGIPNPTRSEVPRSAIWQRGKAMDHKE